MKYDIDVCKQYGMKENNSFNLIKYVFTHKGIKSVVFGILDEFNNLDIK